MYERRRSNYFDIHIMLVLLGNRRVLFNNYFVFPYRVNYKPGRQLWTATSISISVAYSLVILRRAVGCSGLVLALC